MSRISLSNLSSPYLEPNLALWRRHYPEIARRLLHNVRASEIRLDTTASGERIISCPDPSRPKNRATVTVSPENIQRFMGQASRAWKEGSDFFVLVGSLAGMAAVSLASQVKRDPKRGLLVVEPLLPMLFAASFLQDLSALLSSSQIFWVADPDVFQGAKAIIRERKLFGFPQCAFLIPPGEDSTSVPTYSRLAGTIQEEQERTRDRWCQERLAFSSKYEPSTNEFRRGVAFVPRTEASWLLRVSVEALMKGMRQCSVETAEVPADANGYQPPFKPFADLLEASPDFVVSLNAPIRYMMPAPIWDALRIPQVIWYVDNPTYWRRLGDWSLGTPRPSDALLCYDRDDLDTVREWGARHVLYLPTAADLIDPAPPEEEFRCDVSFIGSVFDQRAQYAAWSTTVRELADRIIEEVYSSYPDKRLRPPDFGGILTQDRLPAGSATNLLELSKYVYLEVNNRLRLDAIRRVLRFDLHLYGQSYWQTLLGEKDAQRCYRGMIDYHSSAGVMASSRVNLNLTSLQTGCSLGTRCFNVIAQRGCLVTEWIKGLDHLFEPGEGVVYYQGLDELPELIERCLSSPEERAEIVERGRKRILREHTFRHRAQQILSYLRAHRDEFFTE